MEIDERKVIAASVAFAVIGIAILFFLSETPQKASVAAASVAQENSLLIIEGTATNITAQKFMLCDSVCISVKNSGLPSALLLSNGRNATVQGRVKEYMGSRYIEAEKIGVK